LQKTHCFHPTFCRHRIQEYPVGPQLDSNHHVKVIKGL